VSVTGWYLAYRGSVDWRHVRVPGRGWRSVDVEEFRNARGWTEAAVTRASYDVDKVRSVLRWGLRYTTGGAFVCYVETSDFADLEALTHGQVVARAVVDPEGAEMLAAGHAALTALEALHPGGRREAAARLAAWSTDFPRPASGRGFEAFLQEHDGPGSELQLLSAELLLFLGVYEETDEQIRSLGLSDGR
jgi:hypothetical protein